MSDNPFKEEELQSVFQEASSKENLTENISKNENNPDNQKDSYSKFPKWDLLPPFKLIKRGKQK